MLRSCLPKLKCAYCLNSESSLTDISFVEKKGHIVDGLVICNSCQSWFPIQDEILELVRYEMLNKDDVMVLHSKYHKEFEKNCIDPSSNDHSIANNTEQLKQREHFDWYAMNSEQDYHDYQNTPFWLSVDNIIFDKWARRFKPGSWHLDVGCADGRSAFQFIKETRVIIGCDISKNMIRKAIAKSKKLGVWEQTSFFVADGNDLPVKQESFDNVSTYGVLHHLPDPEKSCRELCMILKKGGTYFAMENNKTILRKIFDWLMKIWPIWVEEAGEEPLISSEMVHGWIDGMAVNCHTNTMIYLPPHIVNLTGKFAKGIISLTDRFFHLVPGMANQGGLIVIEIDKKQL